MKILFDGTCIKQNPAGIGNYAYQLLKKFSNNQNYDVTVVCRNEKLLPIGNNFTPVLIKNKMIKFLPVDLLSRKNKYDIYHQPNYVPHFINKCPKIITVHDMSHKSCPQCHPWARVQMLNIFEERMKKADGILTVSEFSKKEIMKYMGISSEKICVTYLGADECYYGYKLKNYDNEILIKKWHIPENYILYIGTIEPRKNLQRLIQAFAMYKRKNDNDVKLVMAGGNGWLYKKIFDEVHKCNLENDIVFTGYFPSELQPALYAKAKAFVYPSLYEGFGLPILEAMAVGTKIVVSNVASIPEVAGKAGIYFDPLCVEDIYLKIEKAINDTNESNFYKNLLVEQANKFSWNKCFKETANFYKKITDNIYK